MGLYLYWTWYSSFVNQRVVPHKRLCCFPLFSRNLNGFLSGCVNVSSWSTGSDLRVWCAVCQLAKTCFYPLIYRINYQWECSSHYHQCVMLVIWDAIVLIMSHCNESPGLVLSGSAQAFTWTNVDPVLCRQMASLGHNEVNPMPMYITIGWAKIIYYLYLRVYTYLFIYSFIWVFLLLLCFMYGISYGIILCVFYCIWSCACFVGD